MQTSQAGSNCPVVESGGVGGSSRGGGWRGEEGRGLGVTLFTVISSETSSSEGWSWWGPDLDNGGTHVMV